ncbi:MAG: hypothetical protein IPJ06_13890 [Saprospiraceae bacterium]|nr:hypothetical protein [Saprospiraceae bacterium]
MHKFKSILLPILVICLFILITIDASAQCPMCKMSAESNLANGGTAGKGLNAGIIYMLATPYLLVGAVAFLWWRNKKKVEVNQED